MSYDGSICELARGSTRSGGGGSGVGGITGAIGSGGGCATGWCQLGRTGGGAGAAPGTRTPGSVVDPNRDAGGGEAISVGGRAAGNAPGVLYGGVTTGGS